MIYHILLRRSHNTTHDKLFLYPNIISIGSQFKNGRSRGSTGMDEQSVNKAAQSLEAHLKSLRQRHENELNAMKTRHRAEISALEMQIGSMRKTGRKRDNRSKMN